ncbi:glycosyltransferase [Candidatus Methylospira mobilis]|uniref:Glycosyltransferase n=1 Tax=Candidatus Methylospira mobilis TaxID=1808979 RepID=A0A5Q0BIR7_9GAMM|nr:glycosyltransferase [Candidatus Methylospira mobilis]QFY42054.1 glycosyltransferase [Candidatus Methylospira mobilis]WNV03061.1 glycosyltransferase [Candidatus Methylospira mobilis]
MKILRIISSMNPRSGGPSEGIRQLAVHMQASGHVTECLTADAADADWLAGQPLTIHALGPGRSGYAYCPAMGGWLRSHAHEYDAIIVSGLWQYHGLMARKVLTRLGIPYHVMPHGMLDPWFKHTYPLKHLKKWLYWPWAEYRVLRDAQTVIFTCEEERLLARESFWLYQCNERVTAYGTDTPPQDKERLQNVFLAQYPQLSGKRLILFLSRIHVKKGCDLLIEAFASIAAQYSDAHLLMAGPDQTGWQRELEQLAQALGIADRISWPGMLTGDMKWGAFHSSEVFCLPSHQENFGIVVAEALACGKPVLISNKVNIWREIEADRAGWVNEDSIKGTQSGLQSWLGSSVQQREEMSANAVACFNNRFRIDRVAVRLLEIINNNA